METSVDEQPLYTPEPLTEVKPPLRPKSNPKQWVTFCLTVLIGFAPSVTAVVVGFATVVSSVRNPELIPWWLVTAAVVAGLMALFSIVASIVGVFKADWFLLGTTLALAIFSWPGVFMLTYLISYFIANPDTIPLP